MVNGVSTMKNLYYLIILLLFCVQIFAGTTGKITGKVTDANNGEGLIGVNLFLEGTSVGATTDLEGYYVILNVSPGKHLLVVQYVGYQEQRINNVTVSIDLTTRMDIELSEHTLELEEAIIVEGERPLLQKDVTSSQSIVSAEEIDALPVTEINDIIQLQAGVSKDHEGKFHIRGGRTTEIAYWVNGVAVTDAYDNSNGLEVDNSSIQELQVISGTFNAEYGNAMSGIINIVTKEGSPKYTGSLLAYADDYVSDHTDIFNHIDDYNPTANHNIQGNLSGPIPGTDNKITFFMNGRYNYSDGWLYGFDKYNTDGSDGSGKAIAQNWNERYQGQAKLAFYLTPAIKLNAEGIYSKRNFQDYDHDYKYVPEGNVFKYFESYNAVGSLTHTLSATSFYTANVSYYFRDFNEYLYEDPFDFRYTHHRIVGFEDPGADWEFRTRGTNLHRFFRETQTLITKVDFTSQVTKEHLLTLGVEGKFHQLKVDDYDLEIDDEWEDGDQFTPVIPSRSTVSRNNFDRTPYEFSGYIQDKIELEEVIINLGFRVDYFNSNANILLDPFNIPQQSDLETLSADEIESLFFKKASEKWQVSPRLGIAYPISATGVIHFSYGHFLQIPSFQYLFNRSDYKMNQSSQQSDAYGNPDLEPQKTVMYEIGLKQEFGNEYLVDITGFYRDVRDWITSNRTITHLGVTYSRYTNKDYSNVKGVTLTLKKRFSRYYGFDLNYTYQNAEGSNSSPEDSWDGVKGNKEPALFLLPMDWDQNHIVNLSVNVGGEDWGGSLLARYGTGLPYTPEISNTSVLFGRTAEPQNNSERRPTQFILDLKLYKLIKFSGFTFKPFLNIFNLLDSKVIEEVFTDTGSPAVTLQQQVLQTNPIVKEYLIKPWYYGPPRRIQLGLEWMF